MGTFILRPTAWFSGGTPVVNNSDPIPPDWVGWRMDTPAVPVVGDLVLAVNSLTANPYNLYAVAFGPPFDNTIRFSFAGNSFYLDGSGSPISFAGLPAGFAPTAAIVKVNVDGGVTSNAHYYLQQDSGNNGPVDTVSYPYNFPAFSPPTALDIYNNGVGFRVDISPPIGQVVYVYNLRIEGTYTLSNYSWYIKPTQKIVNGQSVDLIADPATDIKTVADGDPSPDGFEFYATSADLPGGLVTFYWWYSPDFYQFFIFSLIPPGPTWIKFGTDPPPCTNCLSLTLLANSVLVADASGIYTLVADKRNDTLYVRTDPAAVTTVDFKLPNPAAKIGFVP